MNGIFTTIATTSVYATVVGLIIILLKRILHHKLNPRWHFLIWGVLILKLILPYGPESAFSLFNVLWPSVQESSVIQGDEPTYPVIPVQSGQPYSPDLSGSSVSEANQPSWHMADVQKALPYLWLLGAVSLLLWLVYTHYVLHCRLKKNKKEAPAPVRLILDQCQRKMGINRKIDIIVQEVMTTPSLLGVIRPQILITPETLGLNHSQISYIFMHELAHDKRKDLLTNYILLGLQILHWFNPVIWYCFRVMRRDMEMAADEKVLAVSEPGEEKEYGKALIAVLESYHTPMLLPQLIGIGDDKNNMKRRIQMIQSAELFKRKRKEFLITGIVCVILLSGMLLTNPQTSAESPDRFSLHNPAGWLTKETGQVRGYEAENLLKYKHPYIGNASNVGNLTRQLPYAKYRQGMSLQTENPPYGATINYDLTALQTDARQAEADLQKNAVVMFALIDNLDVIRFNLATDSGESKLQFSRDELQKSYPRDLREYAKETKDFTILLNSMELSIVVNLLQYTPAMSSTPGIQIMARYNGAADEVVYTTENDTFLGWEAATGKITGLGSRVARPFDLPVYWSPLPENGNQVNNPELDQGIPVQVSVRKDGVKLAEKQMVIHVGQQGFYIVEKTPDVYVRQTLN